VNLYLIGHGSCNINIYIDETLAGSRSEQCLKYLSHDIDRRCLNQYKMVESQYNIGKFKKMNTHLCLHSYACAFMLMYI
jgi:hypothetical protein